MRCQEVRSWTFKGLVAAFVDLSVAFSLLCASILVYLSSKFLSLFGLDLPCPCDGLFSDPHKNKCFQETLGNLSVKKISFVQRSVKNKTPFDSILCKEANGRCVGKKRKGDRRHVELEKEVSDTPVKKVGSWVEDDVSGFNLLTSQSLKKGSFKLKSKRLSFHRSPYGLRNYCQGNLGNKNFPQSPASVIEYLNDVDGNDLLVNSKESCKTLADVSLRKSVSLRLVGCEAGAKNKQPERTFSWAGEGTCSSPVDLTYSGVPQKTIEILEQLLVEERAERSALAEELEKERNAAASAADEALRMILRLQEEKMSIEMEARQYQRVIEEKSAFDAEEMSILKEILLRREREKHFLEKEVDTYRQILETEQPLFNTPDSKPAHIEGSQTPQQMTEALDDMENTDISSGFENFTHQMDCDFFALRNKLVLPGEDDNFDYLKPGEVYNDEVNRVHQNQERDQSRGDDDHEIAKLLTDVEPKERAELNLFPEPVSRSSNISDFQKFDGSSRDSDCHVHDIHVVTAEANKVIPNVLSNNATWDLKLDRSQSVSGTSYELPPACPPGKRNLSPYMRRNSMSAVDYERLKIESEVGLLRGRLRAVQKGREKNSFSSKEHSKSQKQRTGDKTSRFWEIRRSGPLDSSSPSSTIVKPMSMTLDLHSA